MSDLRHNNALERTVPFRLTCEYLGSDRELPGPHRARSKLRARRCGGAAWPAAHQAR